MVLTESNLPEKEDYEYGYAVFDPQPDIKITSDEIL